MAKGSEWAQYSALYQIYPRSFKDSDNDGVGDLKGIVDKINYLKGEVDSLGVDAIWISPFYKSPMADFGYDVSDYYKIDPLFGTMGDFQQLIRKARKHDIRVMLDFVLNHTSDQHKWFKESRVSRDSPKRDWYIWRDPQPDGSPPNNWQSAFDGPAWEYDAATEQYYLHTFLKEQPDLNWANPEVRKAMAEVMQFWFEKGVDGFRIDAVHWIGKDKELRDDPPNPNFNPETMSSYDSVLHTHSGRQPVLFKYLKELATVAKKYKRSLLITESYPDRDGKPHTFSDYIDFYRNVDASVLVPFNFEGIRLPWDAQAFQKSIDSYQEALRDHEMPVYAFSNHDSPRIAARYGQKGARAIAVLSFGLPGLPMMYYGDELGLDNVRIPPEDRRDPVGWTVGDKVHRQSRDPERTPMPWTEAVYGGFSQVKTWLPVGKKNMRRNVAEQQRNPHSTLRLYRQLLTLRRESDILRYGTYQPVRQENMNIMAFIREYQGQKLAVMINFSHIRSHLPPLTGELVISTHQKVDGAARLKPMEARIISLE